MIPLPLPSRAIVEPSNQGQNTEKIVSALRSLVLKERRYMYEGVDK